MGSHWRDFSREKHNQICIFTRILSEESVLENRPQKGRPGCNTPAEWHAQCLESTGGGFSFQLTFWLSPLSEKAKVLDGAHKIPHISGLQQGSLYTQIRTWANHPEEASVRQLSCSFAQPCSRHDTLVFWAATKLSVGPFIQLWTKKS